MNLDDNFHEQTWPNIEQKWLKFKVIVQSYTNQSKTDKQIKELENKLLK